MVAVCPSFNREIPGSRPGGLTKFFLSLPDQTFSISESTCTQRCDLCRRCFMGGQFQAHGTHHIHHGGDGRIALAAEGFVQGFAAQPGLLRDIRYAARTRDDAERMRHEFRVAALEGFLQKFHLRFRSLEILRGIEGRRLNHRHPPILVRGLSLA